MTFTLGGDTATIDDNKDRGIELDGMMEQAPTGFWLGRQR